MPLNIYALLQNQASRFPDSPALHAPNRSALTYAGLFLHIEQTAHSLRRLGFSTADRVAIVLPNGPELAAAFLAVSSCCASAPLNPSYSEVEFDFYLADLNARALLTQAGLDTPARRTAQRRGLPVIELEADSSQPAGLFWLNGDPGYAQVPVEYGKQDHTALVLHTSGTTSRPKIVPLTQANLCASARNIQATLSLTENDRCLNVMPLFHIHGLVAAVLATLASGGCVTCTPGFSAAAFFGLLDSFHPTWYTAVPTMHQAVLEAAASHEPIIARSSLRFIRSSSASLPPKVMADLESTFLCPVVEAYGMTEAAHQMACNPLPPLPRKPGSVGLPAGPQIAILDENGRMLPPGQTGEIVIQGDNVMTGYENNPSANAAAFAYGWFHTGDQGYLDGDGYLFITGRLKEIINRGGEKVAPREVDEVFLEHPAVAQAVTFAVPHRTLGEDVAIALVLKPGQSASLKELRGYALERLASHKVPSQVVIVDQIPKGPTGKLQRIGLAEKLSSLLKPAFIAPEDQVSTALARLWTELLKASEVGMQDNFFALGGDSLLAAQLLARLRSAFALDLPLSLLFQEPTLAGQAAVIEDALLSEIESLSEEEAQRLGGPGAV